MLPMSKPYIYFVVSHQWLIRIEFITGIKDKSLTSFLPPSNTENGMKGNLTHFRGNSNIDVEAFDCVIPVKLYGSSGNPRDKSQVQVFEIR